MDPAVAAGHPRTTDAGVEVLEGGGSAADAAVAASLASCVGESMMTGFLGGGHAIYWDAATGRARNLDCFCAVPGLRGEAREAELLHLDVPFGDELVHYAVGPASCAVPGLPAGLDELWRAHGRLPWARLVEPALRLAREGAQLGPAHAACVAMLAPVLTMNEGAEIYAPGGAVVAAGELLRQPGLETALELVAEEGAGSLYAGSLAEALLALCKERGGLVTRADLETYEARWSDPVGVDRAGYRAVTRGGITGVPEALAQLPALAGLDEPARVLALLDALDGPSLDGHTTNVSVLDGDGNVCVLTTSLGLGSGDYLPGMDMQLNSMLGEADLLRGPLEPGARMESMMAPLLALDRDGLALAIGAAGGTRLRGALVGVAAGVLDEGLEPRVAVERPRFHRVGSLLNVEPGFEEATLSALASRGLALRAWPAQHHYFGGVSLIARNGAASDPRRSGSARSPARAGS